MFNRFDIWKYSNNSNCWDYVREYLLEHTNIPERDIPKYGILPSNKRAMTKAANVVSESFIECNPKQYAIACHYQGNTILHVGIVDGEYVRHTSYNGTMKSKIKDFEKMASKTVYKIHHSLWQK